MLRSKSLNITSHLTPSRVPKSLQLIIHRPLLQALTMAQTRDNVFGPSSPHSSGGGPDSFTGTPDARLAAFSAADGSGKSTRLLPGNSYAVSTTPPARPPGRGFLDSGSQVDKDPFISPGRRTGLSPTASSFQPFNQPPFVPSTLPGSIVSSALSNDLGVSRLISVSGFAKISVTQVESWLKVSKQPVIPSRIAYPFCLADTTAYRSLKTVAYLSSVGGLSGRPLMSCTSCVQTSEMLVLFTRLPA